MDFLSLGCIMKKILLKILKHIFPIFIWTPILIAYCIVFQSLSIILWFLPWIVISILLTFFRDSLGISESGRVDEDEEDITEDM